MILYTFRITESLHNFLITLITNVFNTSFERKNRESSLQRKQVLKYKKKVILLFSHYGISKHYCLRVVGRASLKRIHIQHFRQKCNLNGLSLITFSIDTKP